MNGSRDLYVVAILFIYYYFYGLTQNVAEYCESDRCRDLF